MACPPPRLPQNINHKSKTKTYFISSSPILFLNNGFSKNKIAKILYLHRNTLNVFIKQNGINLS